MRDRDVTRCWFPDPPCAVLEIGNNITARVLDGVPAYQLTSGEVVAL